MLLNIFKKSFFSYVLCVFLFGCQSGEQCQQLLVAKCTRCHPVSTSCAKVGESERRWLGIIDAMVQLNADVSSTERVQLARCLSNSSPATQELCR